MPRHRISDVVAGFVIVIGDNVIARIHHLRGAVIGIFIEAVLIADGHSNRAIAEELFGSPNTRKTHVALLLSKSGVASRVQRTTMATKQNLLLDPVKWSGFIACAWTLLFLAPHVWWALGVPMGFPGKDGAYQVAWSSAWFPRYNLFVVFLSTTSFLVLLALVTPVGRAGPHRVLLGLVWLGAALLTARGFAGLVADKFSDLVWWPTFLLGGVLYEMVAWCQRVSPTERM